MTQELEKSLIEDPYANPFEPMIDSSVYNPITVTQEPWSFAARGKLFLIVGSAGSGKTTLVNRAKQIIGDNPEYAFPRRVIVRSKTENDVEDFEEMMKLRFATLLQNGEFDFAWTSHHGVQYGLRAADIEDALSHNKNVIIQVSRTIIKDVKEKYGDSHRIVTIEITAEPHILRERLSKKRIPEFEIDEKLKRNEVMGELVQEHSVNYVRIENNGTIEEGVKKLLEAIHYKIDETKEVVLAPPVEEEKQPVKAVAEKVSSPTKLVVNENVVLDKKPVSAADILDETSTTFFKEGELRDLIHKKAEASDLEHQKDERRMKELETPKKAAVTTTKSTPIVKSKPGESKSQQKSTNFFGKVLKWAGFITAASAIGFIVVKRLNIFNKSK